MPNHTRTGLSISGKRSYNTLNKNVTFLVQIIISLYGAGQERDNTECLQASVKYAGDAVMI